jgi:hypothetical protein
MNFLRTLSFLLLASMCRPLFTQNTPLTRANLERLGIYEGSRLRIKASTGDDATWALSQSEFAKILFTQVPTNQHFFTITTNPQDIPAILGYGNLGSIFIVQFNPNNPDQIALKVKVCGGGGYNFNQNVDKYANNQLLSTSPIYFDVIPYQAPTAGTGSYVVAFRKGAIGAYAFLAPGQNPSQTAPCYYTIDVLDAHRDTNRGNPLTYNNACYQIFMAGTPLNVWTCGVNYGNGKTLYFGNVTYKLGIKDARPYSTAAAMCILSGKNQSQLSYGNITYGALLRIISFHTMLSGPTVNTYEEIYSWRQCSVGNTIVGWVTQSNQNFVTADDPTQVFIVTSALIPGTSTPIYAENTPVCENDAIRLVPYWNTSSTSTYPYANSTNLWFWNNLTDPQHSGMYWNSNPSYDQTYNLFSLKKLPDLSALTTAQSTQYGPIQAAWASSATYLTVQAPIENALIGNLKNAATQSDLAAIITLLNQAVGITPVNAQTISETFTKAFTNAANLVQTAPDITTLQTIMNSGQGKIYLGPNITTLATVLTSKAAALQAALQAAEIKINTDLAAAATAPSVTIASITTAITTALTAIAAPPINSKILDQATLGTTFVNAFTKAVSCATTAAHCTTIKNQIATATTLFPTTSFAAISTTLTQKEANLAAQAAQQAAETKINTDLAAAATAPSVTIASITTAITTALTAIAAPPINSKILDQTTLGTTFVNAFTKAVSCATTAAHCTTIKNQIATATTLFPTTSFATVNTTLTNKITALTPKPVQQSDIAKLQRDYTKLETARKTSVTTVSKLTSNNKTAAKIAAYYSPVITQAITLLQTTPANVTAAYATNKALKDACNYTVRSIYGIFTDKNLFNTTTKKLSIPALATSLQTLQALTAQFPGEATYKTTIAQAKLR